MLSPLYPDIDRKIDELMNELSADSIGRQPPVPKSLYHYTDASGILAILKSSRLWATHAGYLNDRLEIDHAASLVEAVLRDRKRTSTSTALTNFLAKALTDFNLYDYEHSYYAAYVVSFCEASDLLSQWRGYGATGGGLALGLKPDTSDNPTFSPDQHFIMLKKVEYDQVSQSNLIAETIDRIIALFEASILTVNAADIDRVVLRFTHFLQQQLAVYLITFKDPAFEQEQEWRLVSLVDFKFPHFQEHVTFRAANNLLIPYYELNVAPLLADKNGKLAINDIVIGPTLEAGLTTQSLAMALLKYRYDLPNIDVRESIVPLRF